MICPNCKTDLIEVNGRYICPDCGREIPENEVMAGDWGNGGAARAGLFGAGSSDSTEVGNTSVADFGTTAIDENDASGEQMFSEETGEAKSQIGEEFRPESVIEPTAVKVETETEDTFYITPDISTPVALIAETEGQVEKFPVGPFEINTEQLEEESPSSVPAPAMPEPAAEVGSQIGPNLDVAPEHSQVVSDMFQNTEKEPEPVTTTSTPTATSTSKKLNLTVMIIGIMLVLLTIGGGVWAYQSLGAKNVIISNNTSENQDAAWQELQVVDGGFKIGFPGQPNKSEVTQTVNGVEMSLATYSYTTDSLTYSVGYVALDPAVAKTISANPQASLSSLVDEIAKSRGFAVSTKKVGSYNGAATIDFVMSLDSVSYEGKLLVNGNNYILIMAGGDGIDYNKFINSFTFISNTESATN